MNQMHLSHTEFAELSTDVLRQGHFLRFEAYGQSMSPFIRPGDIVTVEPDVATSLKVGDIVFCRLTNDVLVAHRLIRFREQMGQQTLILQGDAVLAFNESVQPEQVLGRVIRVQRGQKTIGVDRGIWHLAGLLWVWLLPLRPTLFRVVRRVKRIL